MKNIILITVLISAILLNCCNQGSSSAQENIADAKQVSDPIAVEFPSLDSLMISANIYDISKDSPVIVLCHQARFNKFEYEGIAQKLNKLGFNCIAIDQRSGGPIGNKINETAIRALEDGKDTDYIDAEPDIIAAINYAVARYGKPIILWGSSYSSTLALYIAAENNNVGAVVAFSPGNYLSDYKGSLIDVLSGFEKPMFVTSSKREAEGVKSLLQNVDMNDSQILFEPLGEGHHGSRALWKSQRGGEEYWIAVNEFLTSIK
ncbi:MAG: hypothetical protein HQ521_11000 [Bacteroidetes bacterium]|nr:hypothetical protein [Bacteroidota bacterium]